MELIENIDDFLTLGDKLDDTFVDYYGFDFNPKRWGTTALDFLLLVRERVSQALTQEE